MMAWGFVVIFLSLLMVTTGSWVESPGCDGCGDHIPFLADGNYGLVGCGACDGISLNS